MIQEAIYKAGYTFDELCSVTGIPSSTLSDIMSGKAALSHCQARTVRKLAHGLGLSMEELMAMEDDLRAVSQPSAPVHGSDCMPIDRLIVQVLEAMGVPERSRKH